jgi:hypothetical protein
MIFNIKKIMEYYMYKIDQTGPAFRIGAIILAIILLFLSFKAFAGI